MEKARDHWRPGDGAELPTDRGDGQWDEFRRSWAILVACVVGLFVGPQALVTYTIGIYYAPLGREFGWSLTELSIAHTIVAVVLAATSPMVGLLNDRIGEGRVVAISLAAMAFPVALLSQMQGSVGTYWLLFTLLSLFGTGASTLTFSQVVSAHFVRNRGLALGIALCGTGVAALVGPPLISRVVLDQGWSAGYLVSAGVVVLSYPLVVLPILRTQRLRDALKREHPKEREGEREGPVNGWSEALGSRAFWLLLVAFPLVACAATGLVSHYVSLLIDRGLSASDAASVAATTGGFMIVGRLLSGYIVDRVFAPWFAAGIMLLTATAFLGLALGDSRMVWLGGFAVGLSIGAEFDLMAYLVAQYFGMARFGRIYGVIYALTVAAAALSPLAFGAIRDAQGTYGPALILSALLQAAASALFLLLPREPTASTQA